MKLQKHVISASLLVFLAGCGTTAFEGKKVDYKSAGKVPTLEVPPDLTSPAADNRYIVPDRSEERRVGQEGRKMCRSRWSPKH